VRIEQGSMGAKRCEWSAEGFIGGGEKKIVRRVEHQCTCFQENRWGDREAE